MSSSQQPNKPTLEIGSRAAKIISAWRLNGETITRESLAAKVGTSVSTVVRWEQPKHSNPRLSEILAMESVKPGLVSALFEGEHFSFLVPIRTVSEANVRTHWAQRAKRTKSLREAAKFHLMAAVQNQVGRDVEPPQLLNDEIGKSVELTMTRVAPGQLDDDNLAGALKGFRDGIADAFGVDDRHPSLVWKYAQRRGKIYGVEVAVRWHPKIE